MATEKYRYPAAGKWTSNTDNHVVGAVVTSTKNAPFWGLGGGGNSRSVYEASAGRNLGVYRSYFGDDIPGATAQANSDTAKGTVPWVSVKPTATWASVGTGGADAWCQNLANSLGGVAGPVLLSVHHEPEGDSQGTIAQWVAMQDRIYTFTQNKPNIRFGPILTGYDWIFSTGTYNLDATWPGAFNSGDFLAFDDYNYYGAYPTEQNYIDKTGTINHNWRELPATYFTPLSAWCAKKGIKWAIGEFALTHEAADYDIIHHGGTVAWLHNAYDWAAQEGNCLALSYFDSILHSRGDWTMNNYTPGSVLAGAAGSAKTKKTEFVSILKQSPVWRAKW